MNGYIPKVAKPIIQGERKMKMRNRLGIINSAIVG
jgi:hypothetical protein